VEHTSPAGVAHEFNINIRLTKLLLKALPKTAQLDQTSAYTVDYDKQVVATEKYDARKTCKKCSGYLSGIASIGKHIIYIEGAHDDFSPSFICFPQFIGSVKYFAIKHQLKVSLAFACSDFATAICTITVQRSLRSTSLSDVCAALQAGPSLKISTGYFLYALSSYGYGFILNTNQQKASGFHRLPRCRSGFRSIDKYVGLGSSCPPSDLRLAISCVNRF
jgi:hypothetical protein